MPPYPTASVVKSNAVAFIAENALWVANVDGSGERKLVDLEANNEWVSGYALGWSPDGKWISYISGGDLWIISPDGSTKNRVLSASDKSTPLFFYDWSPDSSQLVYKQASLLGKEIYSETVRILNLKTGEAYELDFHKRQFYIAVVRWSPNGRYLVFNKEASFVVFDVTDRKVKEEILTGDINYECSSEDNTAPVWSPNSQWFFHVHGIPVGYTYFWICVSGLDGSTRRIDVDGTIYSDVIWDKTGNFLYFVSRKIDPHGDPNLDSDQRLQRYDVRTQKLESLLSLGKKYISGWSVSISPDGSTLETHTEILENKISYILMDLKSLSIRKFTLDLRCVWSRGSQDFVCLSQSNGYSAFHKLNIQTAETTIFSGNHSVREWAISPIVTTP